MVLKAEEKSVNNSHAWAYGFSRCLSKVWRMNSVALICKHMNKFIIYIIVYFIHDFSMIHASKIRYCGRLEKYCWMNNYSMFITCILLKVNSSQDTIVMKQRASYCPQATQGKECCLQSYKAVSRPSRCRFTPAQSFSHKAVAMISRGKEA